MDLGALRGWIGRTETHRARLTAWQADALSATFDRGDAPHRDGDPLPLGWHWLYFPEIVRLSETGTDGHRAKGGFMPPVPLPRRMWAGSTIETVPGRALAIGAPGTKTSTIEEVFSKTGRGGTLVFVVQRHEIAGPDGPAVTERHTTVYRDAPSGLAPAGPPAPADATWTRTVEPSPVLLFRYSALTLNSHRIHYDRAYVTGVEGYPGLVVHGPLTALLLLDLLRRARPEAALARVEIRALGPLFDTAPFELRGKPADVPGAASLWAVTPDGTLAMTAETTGP